MNRLIGLITIGVIVLAGAVYFIVMMTADNTRYVDPIDVDAGFNAEISGPFDYTTFNLPVGYSKYRSALDDISLFASFDPDYVLSRLPKKIENIVFSSDGLKAMVFEKDKVSFYDVATNTMTEIIALVGGWGSGAFNSSMSDFYTIGYDESTKQDALKNVTLDDGKVADLVYFIRDIKDYALMASLEPTVVFMIDKTNQPNILYKIDIQEASRENILEADYLKLADITSDASFVAFEQGDNQFQSTLKIYDTQTKGFYELPYKVMQRNFIFANDGYAYFVSDSEEGDNIVTVEELLSSQAKPQTITLFKWDPVAQFSQQVDLDLPAMPDRIEVQDNVVRMLVGDEYYDVEIDY